jgi:hypothetical protein
VVNKLIDVYNGFVYKGIMEYEEFERQVNKAGLTVSEFADMVKMRRNSITNYSARGGVPTHWAVVAVLIGEMKENSLDFKELIDNIEIIPKKLRGAAAKGKFGGDKQNSLF